jgi:hypothetical protein
MTSVTYGGTFYPQKLALTSLASGGHLVGIRSQTQVTKFSFITIHEQTFLFNFYIIITVDV